MGQVDEEDGSRVDSAPTPRGSKCSRLPVRAFPLGFEVSFGFADDR